MSEEPFSAEYFQHLLTSLTLNSRALIVELTGLAEKYVDSAESIVSLIEERINKILPKYKLYSFYLLDSIIKNIGSPYNYLFAKNLHKNFTETYLIVDDTSTRQNLINLFKTWMGAKTSAGSDLFSQEVLLKIEKFIIKATSLNNNAYTPDAMPRVSRDAILREGNYLLQYIIAMDEDLDKFTAQQKPSAETVKIQGWRSTRNNLIYEINSISEIAMSQKKDDFEPHKEAYMVKLQVIRKELDSQSLQQQELLKDIMKPPSVMSDLKVQQSVPEIDMQPQKFDILMILGSSFDDNLSEYVNGWGKPQVLTSSVFSQVVSPRKASITETPQEPEPQSLAASLGLGFELPTFETSSNSEKPVAEYEEADHSTDSKYGDDDDAYDPESTINEAELHQIFPPATQTAVRSSLKRADSGDARVVKRVRFEL